MREWLVRARTDATPLYGLTVTLGLGLPLVAGLVTGRMGQGTLAAIGAFLLAFGAPGGPYGSRARSLAVSLAVIGAGGALGGLLTGHPWATVAVIPVVVVLAVLVPWVRLTGAMAVLLTSFRPPPGDPLENMLLMGLGGLWLALLLLAPWPARRLRPLDEALGRAAGAVAAMLESAAAELETSTWTGGAHLARGCDWERSRRRAELAMRDATATYRLYRGEEGASQDLQPQQIIDTLRRMVLEAVGLHMRIHTLADLAPVPGALDAWRSGAAGTTRGLAHGVRSLSTALTREAAAPAPPAPGTPPEPARAGRGADDPLHQAITGQIARSLDRIDSGLDSARRELGGGLRLPPAVHWRRPRIAPGAAAASLVHAVRERPPLLGHAARVSVLTTAATAVTAALRLQHGQWMAVTVLVGLRDTYGKTVSRVVQRVVGNTAGSMIAAVVLALAPARVHVVALMLVFAMAGFTLRAVSYTAWTICAAPLLMMLMDLTHVSRWSVALERIELVAAGGVLAALGARVLWPRGAARQVPARASELLTAIAALTRGAASALDGRYSRLAADRLAATSRAIDDVADVGARLENEPAPDTVRAGKLDTAVRAAHRIRDRLIAVADLTSENTGVASPAARVLDRLADALEHSAAHDDAHDGAHDGAAPLVRRDLDGEFAALDDRIALPARSSPHGDGEREPQHPAAARHELSALAADVDELITALAEAQR